MAKAANPIAEGHHTVTSVVTFDDAAGAIEWYKKALGAQEISRNLGPDGKAKQYTIPQVIDFLNDALLTKGHILTRRVGSFTLIPAAEAFDPALAPPVTVSELPQWGATEIVRVTVRLANMNAVELAPQEPIMHESLAKALAAKGLTAEADEESRRAQQQPAPQ